MIVMPPNPRDGNGCASRARGHDLDAWQPRLDARLFAVTAEVISITDAGMVYLHVEGATEAWWSHDPERGQALLETFGSLVDLDREQGLIMFWGGTGFWDALAVVPLEDATPCVPIARAEQLQFPGCVDDGSPSQLDGDWRQMTSLLLAA